MKKKTNDKIIICLLLLFLPAVGVNAQEVNFLARLSWGNHWARHYAFMEY